MSAPALGLQTYIWNNNLKSILLLCGFPFLLLVMLWAYFAGVAAFGQSLSADPVEAGFAGILQYGYIAFIAAGIWFTISYFSHQSLINKATGAQPTTRAEHPRIYNMLENLCISRGIATPTLYIIDTPVLNAYASGISEGHFAVTLTTGIIDALDDQELEAVLAHELSHILNRDVRLMVVAIVFVGMISFFSQMLFRSLRFSSYRSSGNRKGGAGIALLIAFAVLAVGYLFAIVIRFAISRKREYLADAGSVELTKNPEALIRALQKISGNSTLPDAPAEVRQMFIDDASFTSLFATHPPIEDRIRVLAAMGGIEVPAPSPRGPWG